MKRIKSSLGKRSSSIGRNSDINASNLHTSTNKTRKSCLLQPGFTRTSRSNSVDTINDVGHERSGRRDSRQRNTNYSTAKTPMQRSKSQANLMTPSTPGNNMSYYMPPNMTMGSAKSVRSKMSMDGRERMSSMGARITKKDTRPINDKSFIQEMTEKVQKLAILNPGCKALMSNGKIRPMSTQLFIMLSEMVLRYFDRQLALNNNNYATEIPNVAKTFLYKGKLDRTMLITVSTPHTYANVIAFLGWFVECQEMARALNFELLFKQFSEDGFNDTQAEDDDYDFAILIPHLAKCYNYAKKNKGFAQLDLEFSVESRQRLNDEEFDEEKSRAELQELAEILTKLQQENDIRDQEREQLENAAEMMTKDVSNKDVYLSQTQAYIDDVTSQTERVTQELKKTEAKIEECEKEIHYLNLAVKNQELSLEDKEKLAHERNAILREINLLEAQNKSFSDILYTEQIEVSKQRTKVDNYILEYNRELYENLNSLPNAQDLAIGTNILDPDVLKQHSKVDAMLDSLIAQLGSRPEELEDKLVTTQKMGEKRDAALKLMSDALLEMNEKIAHAQTRIKDKKIVYEMEIQRLQVELKNVTREIEILSMGEPDIKAVETAIQTKKQEMETLRQEHCLRVEKMKQRIVFLDKEVRLLTEAFTVSIRLLCFVPRNSGHQCSHSAFFLIRATVREILAILRNILKVYGFHICVITK
ncbi:hypothetical protein WDU94_000930 [Cyamophila willieti]